MAEEQTRKALEQGLKKSDKKAPEQKFAEEALEIQGQEIISIFEGIDEGIYVCDPESYELLYANAATKALFGPDVVGKKCHRVFQGLDSPCDFCTNPIIFGEHLGKAYVWECQNKVTGRWYRCIDKAIRWPDGRMVRYEMAIDIHDLKQAEEALGESEHRYRRITEAITDYIYTVRIQDGRPVETIHSPACVAVTGYTAEDFKANPYLWIQMVHGEDRKAVEEQGAQALSGMQAEPLEHRIIRKDGAIRWVRNTPVPEYDREGKLLSYDGLIQDITERKEALEALRESEEKYRNVVERANDGIAIVQEGLIKYANPSLAKMTGYSIEEAIDTPFTKYLHPDEVDEAVDYYKRRMAGEQLPARYERGLLHKSGSRIDTEVDGGLITYQDKPATLVIIRDITERKQAEEALKKSAERIKLFAYSVSHDLRSPAVGIYGLTRLLQKHYGDSLDERAKGYCDQISQAAEQIALLVWNINIFISTSEIPLNMEDVKLGEIIQMVKDEFSPQLDIRQISWVQPKRMPEIRADRLSVLRILRNLVENALKYGGDELSEIRIGYEASDAFHLLSVSNDGLGIEAEDSERLFGPFQRQETSRGVEGSGLGLAIVKELTEQHGGKVSVESDPEKETTFYVSIPRNL